MPTNRHEHTSTPYTPFNEHGWRGLIDPSWQRPSHTTDPVTAMVNLPHQTIKHQPNTRIIYINDSHTGPVYVKHVTSPDADTGLLDRFKNMVCPSRAIAVLRITEQLTQAGFNAPYVLLAAQNTLNHTTQELLITRAVQGNTLKQTLTDADESKDCQAIRNALHITAQRVAALHHAGFIHGDLLTGNIILTPDGRDITFIDNDRTRRPYLAWPYARRRNIVQLATRIRRHGLWATRYFVRAYCDAVSLSAPATARMERQVIPIASQRRRKHKKRRYHQRHTIT